MYRKFTVRYINLCGMETSQIIMIYVGYSKGSEIILNAT